MNLLSSYIDGTTIYGMNSERTSELRSFSGGFKFKYFEKI